MFLFKIVLKQVVSLALLILLQSITSSLVFCSDQKVSPPKHKPDFPPPSHTPLVEPINSLGFDIFNKIINIKPAEKNYAISPTNISTALTMAYIGSSGETKEAMKNVLGYNKEFGYNINNLFAQLNGYLTTRDPAVTFNAANSIWLDGGFKLNKQYQQSIMNYYNANVQTLDFLEDDSKDIINRWIEENTDGKLINIVDNISPDALMYIVSAAHFNAPWKYPFNPEWSYQAPFKLEDGTVIKCNMMAQKKLNIPYMENSELGFKAVDLPYGDSSFSMTIILPDEGNTVTNIVNDLSTEKWNDILNCLQTTSIDVKLPSFKIKSNNNLKEVLSGLGMGVAFDPDLADFSGMNKYNSKNIFLDRVIHGIFIDVTEKGTEAGAATVVEIKKRYLVKSLLIDRPFIFAIRDLTSGTILFLGKISNPNMI